MGSSYTKYLILTEEIYYLGYWVSKHGIISINKIFETIRKLDPPKTINR